MENEGNNENGAKHRASQDMSDNVSNFLHCLRALDNVDEVVLDALSKLYGKEYARLVYNLKYKRISETLCFTITSFMGDAIRQKTPNGTPN
jgi:hypothetical protein